MLHGFNRRHGRLLRLFYLKATRDFVIFEAEFLSVK